MIHRDGDQLPGHDVGVVATGLRLIDQPSRHDLPVDRGEPVRLIKLGECPLDVLPGDGQLPKVPRLDITHTARHPDPRLHARVAGASGPGIQRQYGPGDPVDGPRKGGSDQRQVSSGGDAGGTAGRAIRVR